MQSIPDHNSSCISLAHRPPKRSASIASLPTPPHTHGKRKLCGSRHDRNGGEALTYDDDDADDKKLVNEAKLEESFWLPTNPPSTTINSARPALYRRLQAQGRTQMRGMRAVSLSSPVGAAVVPRTRILKSTSSTISPPATPTQRNGAFSDSPDNPFLASALDLPKEVIVNGSDSKLSSQKEKPTIAFVFRGIRRSIPNPYYNASSTVHNPNSQLPPEHPDFEPEERVVPTLLFRILPKNAEPRKSGNRFAGDE
ncbi:hypothetical protein B0H13DRAFT_1854895 [Mycena leptocephala]|nr:hypothetical protein B0H13DRAFT_1854895 [Mycena leptocephala]